MSKKRFNFLIALITVFAAALICFAGCKIGGDTAQDILDGKEMTARVVYYANEGQFNNSYKTRSIYFKADTPVLNVKQEGFTEQGDATNVLVSCTDYLLEGWYYAELDENGNPVFIDTDGKTLKMHVFTDEDGDIEIPKDEYENPLTGFDSEDGELVFRSLETIYAKSSGVPVDFSKKIADGERWYFVANWVEDVRINYVLASDVTITIGDKQYHKDDVIYQDTFGKNASVSISSTFPVEVADATFLQAYSDEQCLEPVTRVQKPTDGENVSVYAQFIEGSWTIVRTAQDVNSMFTFAGLASRQFYIFDDIDCSSSSFSAKSSNFSCTVEGNGHTIRNLKFSQSSINTDENYSMLGKLTATAKLSNLTFENVSVTLETRNDITADGLYLFCGDVAEGAVIENVKLVNSTLTFGDARKQSAITNIPRTGEGENSVYGTGNWMFGGLGSDAEFMDKYGVTVNGYRLEVLIDIIGNTETLASADYAE